LLQLKEKNITVIILPDKDNTGIDKAITLEKACLESEVKHLRLNIEQLWLDKPDKYDIADFISFLAMKADSIIKVLNHQIQEAMNARTLEIKQQTTSQDSIQEIGLLESQLEEREITKEKIDSLLTIENYEPDLEKYLQPTLAKPFKQISLYLGMRPVSLLTILLPISASLLFNDVNKLILNKASDFEALPIIYTAICAPSGSGKSPAYKTLMKPLLEMQTKEDALYEIALEEWENAPKEEKADKPTIREYYINDATTEAIARIQGEQPDKGLLGYFDELAQLFKQNGQYKNGHGSDVEKLLSGRDGTGIKVNRAGGTRISCPRSGYSLTGGIQPPILKNMMGNFEDPNGLWARFVFVNQLMQKKPYPEENHSLGLTSILKQLYQFLGKIRQEFIFSSQAQQQYRNWYELVEEKKIDEPKPALQSVWSKSQRLVGEIALILHCLKYGVYQQQPPREVEIDILDAAIDLTKFYIGQITSIHADGDSDKGDIDSSLAAIIHLSKRKGWIKAKDVKVGIRAFKKIEPDAIRSHFRELETMGYGSTRGNSKSLEWNLEVDKSRQSVDTLSTATTIVQQDLQERVDKVDRVDITLQTNLEQLPKEIQILNEEKNIFNPANQQVSSDGLNTTQVVEIDISSFTEPVVDVDLSHDKVEVTANANSEEEKYLQGRNNCH
jgi:hypothetical protein